MEAINLIVGLISNIINIYSNLSPKLRSMRQKKPTDKQETVNHPRLIDPIEAEEFPKDIMRSYKIRRLEW